MAGIVSEILALPEKDRLPAALDALRDLEGDDDAQQRWLGERFGLSPLQARVALVLNARAPHWVPTSRIEQIVASVSSTDDPMGLVNVVICRMRKILRPFGIEILTQHGSRRLAARIDVPKTGLPPVYRLGQGRKWTDDDDNELCRMVANGSHISAIAEELDRTERGCLDRLGKIRRGAYER